MLVLDREDCTLKIHSDFADLLEFELHQARMRLSNEASVSDADVKDKSADVDQDDHFAGGVIFSFKDPTYSFESGGYHPVEVCINSFGKLQYVTDFAHVGRPPQVELAKELDFDFEVNCFGHVGIDYPLSEGAELFAIFQENFVGYYQADIFAIEVSS